MAGSAKDDELDRVRTELTELLERRSLGLTATEARRYQRLCARERELLGLPAIRSA